MTMTKHLRPSLITTALSLTLLLSACGDKSSDAENALPKPNIEQPGSASPAGTLNSNANNDQNLNQNSETPSDDQLAMQAQTLLEEEGIDDVEVQFLDGHATLSGSGLTNTIEASVLSIVREMTGVKSVTGKFQHNEVSQESIDSDLSSTALRLLEDEGLKGIEVNVDNRIATLSGAFPGVAKAQLAGDLITAQEGISRVAMIFTKADGTKITDADLESAASCKTLIGEALITGKIEFESGSSRLTKGSKSIVSALAKTLADCPSATVAVSGHTDSTGSKALNQRLSEQRAQTVAKALASEGIAENRISAKGEGSNRPIASNSTPDGRAQNRRIEFSLDL